MNISKVIYIDNSLCHLIVFNENLNFLIFFFVLIFLIFKLKQNSYYFKDLSSKKTQSYFNSEIPPFYPNGWIPVAQSFHIKSNQIYQSNLCENEIIIFRDENYKPVCLDAYCPHLGANLACGGTLFKSQNKVCIRCPFHSWSFDKKGKCIDIPYEKTNVNSNKTSIKTYEVQEMNDFIYVWYHANGEKPDWYPETLKEISKDNFKYMGTTEHIVSCHFQEIPENGADLSHLNAIHKGSFLNGFKLLRNKWLENFIDKITYHEWIGVYDALDDELKTEVTENNNNLNIKKTEPNHTCLIFLTKNTIFLSKNIFQMNIRVKQIGPAIVHLKFDSCVLGLFSIKAAYVQSIQPIEPLKHKIIHHFYTKESFINRILSKLFLYGEAIMIERDIKIWSQKKFLKNPCLVKSERSISKFRKWFSQFYSSNSLTLGMSGINIEW